MASRRKLAQRVAKNRAQENARKDYEVRKGRERLQAQNRRQRDSKKVPATVTATVTGIRAVPVSAVSQREAERLRAKIEALEGPRDEAGPQMEVVEVVTPRTPQRPEPRRRSTIHSPPAGHTHMVPSERNPREACAQSAAAMQSEAADKLPPELLGLEAGLCFDAKEPARSSIAQDDEEMCVVCLSERPDHAFLPCGHLCACQGCVKSSFPSGSNCPMCRTVTSGAIKIFASCTK